VFDYRLLLARQRAAHAGYRCAWWRPGSGAPAFPARRRREPAQIRHRFQGGPLAQNGAALRYHAVVTVSAAPCTNAYVIKVVARRGGGRCSTPTPWARFRSICAVFLRLGDKTLSETWLYQYFPS